jgi:ABC-type glycerol-3-phosphate transport system substrate-binding protein
MLTLSRMTRWFALFVCTFVLALNAPFLAAQDDKQVISLAVPDSMEIIFQDVILPRFREENPTIQVHLTTHTPELYRDLVSPTSQATLDTYLEASAALASSADVHLIPPFTLTPEATRLTHFLDLNPLIQSDAGLNPDDFVPAAWQSYQWEGGFWALPVLITPLVTVYDPAAFDASGLAYPTESWTLADYANAAQHLTHDGKPGLQVYGIDLPRFFRILLGRNFTDDGFPAQPAFDSPELSALVEEWAALEAEGAATRGFQEDAPLRFARLSDLVDRDLRGVLAPAGSAAIDVYSVALSSGTQNPDAAYRLAVYLTSAPEMQTIFADALPARYSIQSTTAQAALPEDAVALGNEALANALPVSESLFGSYVAAALDLTSVGEAAPTALQTAQLTALDNLAAVAAKQGVTSIEVPVFTPVPEVPAGEVTIKFGLFTGSTSLANRGDWEEVIAEFVETDPEISQIDFQFVAPVQGYWDAIPQNECVFGYSYTGYTDEELVALDPLLDADPTFNPANMVGDVMSEAQRNGHTFALPVAIYPYVLRYNRDIFEAAGLPEPDVTWTVSEFVDALNQLATVTEGAPFYPNVNYPTPWEMLMVGYGAVPIDYSTTPPTLHINDEAVVPVIQQVLDLGKNNLIAYQPMATFFGSGGSSATPPALTADYLSDFGGISDDGRFGVVTFPVGTELIPVSYYTSSGFIFAHAQYPEACYRWLREIAQHPELFEGMPADTTIINDPATQALYGENVVATFNQFASLMSAPNHVFIASAGLGNGLTLFLARAFDRYVLEDADLATELRTAADLTEVLRACVDAPDADLIQCLLDADPTIRENIPAHVLGDR